MPQARARKKLIEVAVPLDAINKGCESDKNRKTGHIRNVHKWFAPMPLPAWRTLLLASVIDDPGTDLPKNEAASVRKTYFDLLRRLAELDAYKDANLMAKTREFLRHHLGTDEMPTVVDPFCGGGSTIVEAQRLRFPVLAADLNPIPVIVTTALCRLPQLLGQLGPINPTHRDRQKLVRTLRPMGGVEEDVRYYARLIQDSAWERLAHMYSFAQSGQTVAAWRWAWCVRSPDPAFQDVLTPLVTNWRITGKKQGSVSISPSIEKGRIRYQITRSPNSPVQTAGAHELRCLFSNRPIPNDHVRAEGKAGRLEKHLLCVVAQGAHGQRQYFPPSVEQIRAALVQSDIELPNLSMPERALGFRVQGYGIDSYSKLFTHRQGAAVATFADLVASIHQDIERDALEAGLGNDGTTLQDGGQGARAYADGITTILALCVDRLALCNNVLVQWFIDPRSGGGKATPAFRMQTLSMVWDFVETNPFAQSVGGWTGPVVESVLKGFSLVDTESHPARVFQLDARSIGRILPRNALIATDPPYYANIGYADLSDFFYVWLRRSLRAVYPSVLTTIGAPKAGELIANPFRHADGSIGADEYFRRGFTAVFEELMSRTDAKFPILVMYALKQAESGKRQATGWEVFLDGLIASGLSIVATWPIRTTTATRTRGLDSNALASAICVVCRPRDLHAGTASRQEFVSALNSSLPLAVECLQQSNIAPVDLVQSAIGPGMAVFSRYDRVLNASGTPLSVRDALALINQTLDSTLAEQECEFDADSRWALAWFEQHGFDAGDYGVAETLSKAKNTSVGGMVSAGILVSRGGKVRLLRPKELPSSWDPATDSRLTAWEMVHHLVRILESDGEAAAGTLASSLGGAAEIARELCYRLYTVCERRKRAADALSYNGLVQSWPEISRLAQATPPGQPQLFGESD